MPTIPDSDFSKQAHDAIKTALSQGARGTPAAMARVVVDQINNASRASQDQRQAVNAVCRAALGDLHLLGLDLSETTLQILHGLSRISLMTRVGPQDLMTWVMEGIAQAAAALHQSCRDAMIRAIESEFMGAGSVFAELCEKMKDER
jgi:hypothetical protein